MKAKTLLREWGNWKGGDAFSFVEIDKDYDGEYVSFKDKNGRMWNKYIDARSLMEFMSKAGYLKQLTIIELLKEREGE